MLELCHFSHRLFSFFSHFSSFFQFLVNNVGVMYDYPQYFLDVPKQVTLNAPSFVKDVSLSILTF